MQKQDIKTVFINSFIDPRGSADFKALTVFLFVLVFILSIPVGLWLGKWIPESYLNYIFIVISIGIGADTAQNLQALAMDRKQKEENLNQ